MKVCWFGIYDPSYNRNSVLLEGLRENGVAVVECNARGVGFGKYVDLLRQLKRQQGQYDVLFCAFPVHVTIVLAWLFQSKLIVTDAFFPKYESVVFDRKTHSKFNVIAWWYWVLDYLMVKLADHVITDTEDHKVYWKKFVAAEKVTVIPVGVNTHEFYPIEQSAKRADEAFIVHFHGSYIPLQGVDKIIEAARLLKDRSEIKFRLIGGGQTYKAIYDRAQSYQLCNVEFISWLSTEELNQALNEADVVLGIFGDTDKTDRVVPNKLYQGVAVKKPVITKDTAAMRNYFSEDEVIYSNNSPEQIAEKIIWVRNNYLKAQNIAGRGFIKLQTMYSPSILGQSILKVLSKL